MSDDTRLVHGAIKEGAADAGFSKAGSSWYAMRPESVLRIALQKSQYGKQYFLNFGICFREFAVRSAPSELECQLRGRLEDLATDPTEEKVLSSLLDFETACNDRQALLAEIVRSRVVPFLDSVASLEGARKQLATARMATMALAKPLRERLNADFIGPENVSQ